MGTKIIELLSSKKNNNLTLEEISVYLGEDKEYIFKVLALLEQQGIIFKQSNNKYILVQNTNLKRATIKFTTKKGLVAILSDNTQLQLTRKDYKKLRNNDLVLVEPYTQSGMAKVVRILNKTNKNYIGEVIEEENQYKAISEEGRSINLKEEYPIGTKLLIDSNTDMVLEVIGHKDDYSTVIKEVLLQNGFPISFKDEYLKELEAIPTSLSDEDIINLKSKKYLDITTLPIITVDGADTKDFDDAVGYLDNNIYISIANTSRYFKEGSAIWDETLKRGISVYPPGTVNPMLHHKFSNGICSLVPGEARSSLSTSIQIDKNGKVLSYKIFPSIIKNQKRTTYEEVNEYLENETVIDGYQNYLDLIENLYERAMVVKDKMLREGFLNFSSTEVKYYFENAQVIKIDKRHQGKAEELIEFLMILDNMVMVDYFIKNELPFIARNHEEPNYEKLKSWSMLLRKRNYKAIVSDKLKPEEIMHNRKLYEGNFDMEVLDRIAIRCRSKARYSSVCEGHYALGSIPYATFTSTIRRLPDFINQRIYFDSIEYGKDYARKKWAPIVPLLANIANDAETRAEKVEQKLDDIKMAEYMGQFIGCEYTGVVSEVSTSYIKVLLPNMCEGKIKLYDKEYRLCKNGFTLLNCETGENILIGDQINVKLKKVNKITGEIELLNSKENKKYEKESSKTKKKVKNRQNNYSPYGIGYSNYRNIFSSK